MPTYNIKATVKYRLYTNSGKTEEEIYEQMRQTPVEGGYCPGTDDLLELDTSRYELL